MDVHRCRFVEWSPHAINALAFSHSSGSSGRERPLRLAIARANGDIELWDPRSGVWCHETTLHGGSRNSVEALTWTHDADEDDGTGYILRGRLRLFSVGHSEAITEWNLVTGQPLQISGAGHSEIWCLAAQPEHLKRSNDKGVDATEAHEQAIAAGCADGSIVLYSTQPELCFKRFVVRAAARQSHALSITWQWRKSILAGFTDSSIRIFNAETGNHLRTLSLGGNPRQGPKNKLIWALHCLSDGTIASADSSGDITFWHGNTYAQLQRIKGHESDALCLTSNQNSTLLFSGGMDRRTVIYGRKRGKGTGLQWSKVSHKRYHAHDVKTMGCFENSSMSVVVSGGLDTTPIIVPARHFGRENHRKISHIPQTPQVVGAQRWLVTWADNVVTIWTIKAHVDEGNSFFEPRQQDMYKTVGRLILKDSITSLALSKCGKFLLVITATKSKAFYLKENAMKSSTDLLKIEGVSLPKYLENRTIRIAEISPDSGWLFFVDAENRLRLSRIHWDIGDNSGPHLSSEVLELERKSASSYGPQNWLNGTWGAYSRTVSRVVFSNNSRVIAMSDLSGALEAWMLTRQSINAPQNEGLPVDSDSEMDVSWDLRRMKKSTPPKMLQDNAAIWRAHSLEHRLPQLSAPVSVMSFRPCGVKSLEAKDGKTQRNGAIASDALHDEHEHGLLEDTLVVLTSLHELYEFDLVLGKLTDWSKRNPPAHLPEDFKLQRDRAVGCVWQVATNSPKREPCSVIWFYSASWLCMFDISKDCAVKREASLKKIHGQFVNGSSLATKKRKRGTNGDMHETTSIRNADLSSEDQQDSGAGSRVHEHELTDAVSLATVHSLKRDTSPVEDSYIPPSNGRQIHLPSQEQSKSLRVFHDDEPSGSVSGTLRESGTVHRHTDDIPGPTDGKNQTNKNRVEVQQQQFYLTTRYRNIIGIIPMGQRSNEGLGNGDTDAILEVAIVERPLWEADLRVISAPASGTSLRQWEMANTLRTTK